VGADDLATIMYTSGTTGLPKGICHTHYIRAMYASLMASAWRMTSSSVVLHAGAIVFNGAMVTMFPAFMLGATYVVHRAFDAEAFIDTVERERVTHAMLVPAQIIAILNARGFDAGRLASLECILSLGAPLHQEHKERLSRLLPDRFYELYGLTEGFVTILDRDDALRKSGSVGVPPPFYDLRIEDPDGNELPARRDRRDRRPRADHDGGLLRAPGEDRGGVARRVAAQRRPRLRRRRGLPAPGRPHEGHDRLGRRQGLPEGRRGSRRAASRRARGRGCSAFRTTSGARRRSPRSS
jgi:acyl-CoA synthetase (AMP-forming)/AMP-acid ligase II